MRGEDAYCIDINTDFKMVTETCRGGISTRVGADQISDVALSIEYINSTQTATAE